MHSMSSRSETQLRKRLDLILGRIESPTFLKSDGLGNEIGFWVFDYPAEYEIMVRNHLAQITKKLAKKHYNFACINIFKILIEMLESRNLLDRTFTRERQAGAEALRKTLTGPLSQEKVARYLEKKISPGSMDFVLLAGLGNAWPLVRGHELLSALQDVMGSTPLVLFYPGEYSGLNLHPFGLINSSNYYRAFELVPKDAKKLT